MIQFLADINWDSFGVALEIRYSAIGKTEAIAASKGIIEAIVYYDSNGKIMGKVSVIDNFFPGSKSRREHYKHFSSQLLLQVMKK